MTVEFGLFIVSVIAHRDEFISHSYPFDRRSNWNCEMTQFNQLRDQCRQKSPPIKQTTTTQTSYSYH